MLSIPSCNLWEISKLSVIDRFSHRWRKSLGRCISVRSCKSSGGEKSVSFMWENKRCKSKIAPWSLIERNTDNVNDFFRLIIVLKILQRMKRWSNQMAIVVKQQLWPNDKGAEWQWLLLVVPMFHLYASPCYFGGPPYKHSSARALSYHVVWFQRLKSLRYITISYNQIFIMVNITK